jgi:SSS family transporter
MHPIDLGVIAAYLVVCTAMGAWLGSGAGGLKDYFLGERDIPAWAVMISIVATETSAATFLSVPGVSYKGDFTYLQLAMGYILARVFVAIVLLPSYFRGEIYTAYQVLAYRFGGSTQKAASILFLVTRTLGSGLRLFLAAKVLETITGWSLPTSILIIGASTILYTYLGGLKGVVWADVLQFVVYILGALVALTILFRIVPGGWSEIVRRADEAGKLRVFNLSPDLTIPFTFWAGMLGGLVLDTGTHGTDQMMVQRYLSARSQRQAAWALIASGFVILAQFALFLFLGVGLWVLYQDEPPASALKADQEFAYFIVHYLPVGVKGLIIAAVFSVTMSTVSGALSASASSTINDLYRPIVPNASEAHLLRLSKGLTAFWGLAEMGVALGAIGLRDNVVNNALAIASFVTGILLGLFLLGVLTRRVGEEAALIGMVAGIAAVSYVKFGPLLAATTYRALYPFGGALAWPWYAMVGSGTVVAVGLLASPAFPASSTPPATPEGPAPR